MNLRQRQVGDVCVLTVEGRLDEEGTAEFRRQITGIMDAGTRYLVVDIAELDYLCSWAIGTLVSANGRIRKEGGALYLAGARPHIMDLLELLNLKSTLHLCASTEEALAQAAAPH